MVVCAFLAGVAWWLWLPSQLSEGGERFLMIRNETDTAITVIQRGAGGIEYTAAEVPPHSVRESVLPCAAEELVAVDEHGAVVARRPASETCNLTMWVVERDD